jgi:hypothetical protein
MILAKEFEALACRRNAFMSEIIDALLSCYHRGLDYSVHINRTVWLPAIREPSALRIATTVATDPNPRPNQALEHCRTLQNP